MSERIVEIIDTKIGELQADAGKLSTVDAGFIPDKVDRLKILNCQIACLFNVLEEYKKEYAGIIINARVRRLGEDHMLKREDVEALLNSICDLLASKGFALVGELKPATEEEWGQFTIEQEK